MKRLGFLTFLLAVVLSSCVKSQFEETQRAEVGEALLQIGLSVDESLQIVQTKADDTEESIFPEVDSLYVELYRFGKKINAEGKEYGKEGWNRTYFGKYEQAKDTVFRVNAGQWRLVAFHGDSTACGFNKPYVRVDSTFTLDGGFDENGNPDIAYINAKAKVANVRITVDFDETVPGSFYDYFVRFARIDTSAVAGNAANKKYKQILRYAKDQKKDAYMMPTDSLQIQFMAQYEYGDENSWRYATLGTVAVNSNDHLKLGLSVNPRNGSLDVNIAMDDNIVKKEESLEIKEIWTPQAAPVIVASGFPEGDHPVVEGDRTGNNATISILARGGLRNCFLKVESDYLTLAGIDVPLGEEIDLANPSVENQAKLDRLAAAGFRWQADMLGARKLTYLTMTDLFARINDLNPSLAVERNLAKFSIRVVDEVGKETTVNLTSTAYPITQTLSIPEGKVWSKKILSPELKVEKGLASLFMLQISYDGSTWSDFKTYSVAKDNVLDYGTIDVNPSTTYHFRTVYNKNMNLISNVVTVRTEDLLQVGNSSFEDYQTTTMHVSPLGWLYDYDREWYLPFTSEATAWWAVNSKKTMPDGHTAWTSNYCKNFPCTAYSTERHTGDKSAMVYTINVGDGNADDSALGTSVPGEIWLGKADDSGNHSVDGHAFASRPSAVKFWYRYAPVNSENFAVYISLKDAAGNEIARSEKLDGTVSYEWSQCEIPVVYSELQKKAASLYICFKSAASSPSVKTAVTMEIAGKNQKAHIGSVLRIDDIELVY